jgi:hypothetical protein
MNKKLSVLAVAVVTVFATSCKDKSETSAESKEKSTAGVLFNDLVGTWKNIENPGNFERWTKTGDSTYHSIVFTIAGNDTTWSDEGKIYPQGTNWIFDAGKDDHLTPFTATKIESNAVHFTNPAHDFPTDIHYHLMSADSLHAFIVGPNAKGGKDTIPYHYTRVKQ